MLLSAVSVSVVAQSSSEIPEGLMNNPVLKWRTVTQTSSPTWAIFTTTSLIKHKQLSIWCMQKALEDICVYSGSERRYGHNTVWLLQEGVPSCMGNHPHAQVAICRQSSNNAHTDKHSGTIFVILARHWLWLPDDGSCVDRNMLEQFLYF